MAKAEKVPVLERPLKKDAAEVAIEVEVHPGWPAALDAVADAAHPRHAFLRRAWYAAAEEPLTTLVALRADGRPIVALPSFRAKPGVRAVPGCYWPFRSFPIAADASDAELVAFLSAPNVRRTLGVVWRLGPVLADDPTLLRLGHVAHVSGWSMMQRHAGMSYELDISEEKKTGPWPRPSTLKNIGKHEKKLAKVKEMAWRHVAGSDWTEATFDDLATIERNSWVGKQGGDAKFLVAERRKVWETAVADPVIAGALTAGMLLIDGKPVCFSFGVNAGGRRYSIATSYDEEFARHSVGYLTGYRTYAEAAEAGADILNLGTGDSGAKASMGASPGPEMVDCLFVRSRLLAALLGPIWKRSGLNQQ